MRAPIIRKSRCQLRAVGSKRYDRNHLTVWTTGFDHFAISLLIHLPANDMMVNRRGQLEICYYNHVLERRESAPNAADFPSPTHRSNLLFSPFSPFLYEFNSTCRFSHYYLSFIRSSIYLNIFYPTISTISKRIKRNGQTENRYR